MRPFWIIDRLITIIFVGDGREIPDTEFLRKHLLREGHINKPELVDLLNRVTDILSTYMRIIKFTYYIFNFREGA